MVREKEQPPEDLGPPWTVLKLLRWTAGYFEQQEVSGTPRLDADLLLAEVLDLDRVELYARFDTPVEDSKKATFRELVKRRASGEPVAYLIGRKSFWQLELSVDERAMIPRPETEVLVEQVLEVVPSNEPLRVVDVGTGTGAVAFALASERPDFAIAATDASEEALELAAENRERLGFDGDRISLHAGDLLEALPEQGGEPDVVVSNPPYVPEPDREDLAIHIRAHEPDEALFAGENGLEIIERLVPQAHDHLSKGGWLFLEIGAHQGAAVSDLLEASGFEDVAVRRDYADHDRVVHGRAGT